MSTTEWVPDLLGDDFRQCTIDLGADPDREAPIVATVVHYLTEPTTAKGVMLYIHGLSDYFFQVELAEFAVAHGYHFYAIDLRKCGRSRRRGHTPHHIEDLASFDVDIDRTRALIAKQHPGLPVTLMAHSTGGLIAASYLHRRRNTPSVYPPIVAAVLNSPWLDLQGSRFDRTLGTQIVHAVAVVAPRREINRALDPLYGESLHHTRSGEWDYSLEFKPLGGFGVTFGFVSAVRRAQARLHRGWDIGVDILVLHSNRSESGGEYRPEADVADCVLDVNQIAWWAPALGRQVTAIAVPDARHDVLLSRSDVRRRAYQLVADWLACRKDSDVEPHR